MPGVGVILNPHARGNRRAGERVAHFQSILGRAGDVQAPATEAELIATLRRFREEGIDVLAICGGDGSVSYVLTRALRVWQSDELPRSLLLRGGTINNLARSLHTRGRRADAALSALLRARRDGIELDTVPLDLIRVNGCEYGYTVGAGMIVRFLERYYESQRPGPARAMMLLARLGASYVLNTAAIAAVARPVEAEVSCDGTRLAFSAYTLLVASTIAHIGLGVKPFHHVCRANGRMHVLAGPATPGELLRKLPSFFVGRPSELGSLHDCAASRVRVEFAQPQIVMINGDFAENATKVLEMEVGPRVRLIRC
jgi:diacylglycerol kinase family enzyme